MTASTCSMRDPAMATELLLTAPPRVTPATAREVARFHYGLDVTPAALAGERDCNYQLVAADGAKYVLKFWNQADDALVREFQPKALEHIARVRPAFPVPRVIRTQGGGIEFIHAAMDGGDLHGVLISFLDGDSATKWPSTARLRHNVGRMIADLSAALHDFDHPRADRVLLWDMMHAIQLAGMLPAVRASRQRAWIEQFLCDFDTRVRPAVAALRPQIIHNDLSGSNMLLDRVSHETVAGVIDFGDMVRAPLINEIAVAASYQIDDLADPFDGIGDILEGFEAARSLTSDEVEHLFDLILARLCIRVIITEWRAERFPDNRAYILRSNPKARNLLDRFMALPRTEGRDKVLGQWRTRRNPS